MKKLAILGSTGSIGTQTLEIVRNNPDLKVLTISGNRNVSLLAEQIMEFSPKLVCVFQEENVAALADLLKEKDPSGCVLRNTRIVSGIDGLCEAAAFDEAEITVGAVVGMVGIRPAMAAIKAGKDLALANKETLVCAGKRIMHEAKTQGVNIYPVDSEHSAIFQSLNGEAGNQIDKILLTASGGPFRGKTREELAHVTLKDALKHPNWSMGQKVTIDSSTLANKGLEVIEAKWLFDVEPEQIQVVVQPQSIIHSAVQFKDGAIMAQLGTPDMKIPIQYALFYPQRRPLEGKRVDLFELGKLEFEKPDTETFKALALAYRAIETGGSLPTVFNAANERAVSDFVAGKISYLGIAERIEAEMDSHKVLPDPTIEEIIEIGESIMFPSCENR
ncbi:MAG: 1-deoxy-D-xylulose-5-phosphate reductoisomerase [Parasporobacterium sp.]|nr:1-deoxy-D-xylulose-5-phosphate reductoisomerase [Parasporobacterium sp.]